MRKNKFGERIEELDAIIRKAYEDQGYGPINVVFYHCKVGIFFEKRFHLHGEKGQDTVIVTFQTGLWGKKRVEIYHDCNDFMSEKWAKTARSEQAIKEKLTTHGYTNVRDESLFDETVILARFT